MTTKNGRPKPKRIRFPAGLELRDYFAAKAMQGLVHDILIEQSVGDLLLREGLKTKEFEGFLAMQAYGVADAMLRERKRQ
jgi:hypothetical protein